MPAYPAAPNVSQERWRKRVLWLHAWVCFSHLYVLALLAGHWQLGHMPGQVLAGYTVWITTGLAAITWAYLSGYCHRMSDPNLFLPHQMLAIGGTFGLLAWAPATGLQCFMMLVVFCADGFIAPSRRSYVLTWIVTTLGSVVAILVQGPALATPMATTPERWLAAAALIGAFLRSVGLLMYFNKLRHQLVVSRTRLNEAMQQLKELATHDELTGLANRRHILEWLGTQLAQQRRNGAKLSVALLDLDHFKLINDRFGHPAGDRVLREFARQALAALRDTDRLGRYGGEEFLLVLGDTDEGEVFEPLERIRQQVAAYPWNLIAPALKVTVSIGGSEAKPGQSAEEIIQAADCALYDAKSAGRNRVVIGGVDTMQGLPDRRKTTAEAGLAL